MAAIGGLYQQRYARGERDKDAMVWDASLNERSGGHFFMIKDVSDYDGSIKNGKGYSCVINTEDWF